MSEDMKPADKIAAADSIRKFGKYMQGLLEYAKWLDLQGAHDNIANEAERRYQDAVKKLELMKGKVKDLEEKEAKLKKSVVDQRLELERERSLIIALAEEKAQKAVRDANHSADDIINRAAAKAKSYEDEIKRLKELSPALEREAAQKQLKLDSINEEIARIKGKF